MTRRQTGDSGQATSPLRPPPGGDRTEHDALLIPGPVGPVPASTGAVPAPAPGWRCLTSVDVAFIVYCLVVAAFRFAVLVQPGTPPGIDGGNWLAFGHDLLGERLRSSTIVYPPVIPVLVTAAAAMLGPVSGIAIVAATSSLAASAAVYVALRRAGLGVYALLLAGLLGAAGATGEAAAWGGYPQSLASGSLVVFLLLLDRYARSPGRGSALITGAALAVTLATSHFIGLVAIVAGSVLVALAFTSASGCGAGAKRATLRWLPAIALPCLPLVPLYLSLTPMLTGLRTGRASDDVWAGVGSTARWLFRDLPAIWWPALGFAILAPLVLVRSRDDPLWRLATSLLMAVGILLVATGEPRHIYLVPVGIVTALALLLRDPPGSPPPSSAARRPFVAVLAAVFVAQSFTAVGLFPSQRDFYRVLTPGVVAGIVWLGSSTPEDAVVAVSPVRDAPFGWWVEGLSRRRVLPGSALRWLNFEDERARARRANAIFQSGRTGEFPDAATLAMASALGADFLFLNKLWHGYSLSGIDRLRASQPDAFVFENDDVLVLQVVEAA